MIDLFSNSKKPAWIWPAMLALLAAILLFGTTALAQDVVQTLALSRAPMSDPPPAVLSESFIVTATPAPTAIVILLPGGAGLISLTPTGSTDGTLDVNSHNFVVRSRSLFAGHNLDTITLDAATDFYLLPDGLAGQEGSAAHVSDILEVISWARSKAPGLPVWIVGTSRGTGGAFVAASYGPAEGGPDGLVFAASVNDSNDPDSLLAANLGNITVPVLIINDAGSTCSIASVAGQSPVLKALKHSPRKGVEQVPSAGLTALTGNCDALSGHGFFGSEDTAVRDIAVWMAK
ncbi:MAG: hypothetical protein WCC99_07615 [Candidatus Sulfotelmatobacter sp.]